MQTHPTLYALAKAQSSAAQSYLLTRRPLAHVGALGAAVLMLFVHEPPVFYYLLGILATLTEMLAWWFHFEGERRHRLSRELNRRALLVNAFGNVSELLELADLRACLDDTVLQQAAQLDKEVYNPAQPEQRYYTSGQREGSIQRLLDNLQESAFWSKHLYQHIARHTFKKLGLITGLVLLVLLGSIPFSSPIASWWLAPKIIAIFLAFMISDELTFAVEWRMATNRCDVVIRRVECILAKRKTAEDEILAVFGDYAAITETAPPIPSWVYTKERERLNGLWEEKQGRNLPPT